jgi:hypothetical protein
VKATSATYLAAGLVLCAMGCAAASARAAANWSNIVATSVTSYFDGVIGDLPAETDIHRVLEDLYFRPVVAIPDDRPPLRGTNHLQICQDFAWWANQIVKPEYVPSLSFIVAHIELFPATPEMPYDTAFLPCRKGDRQYMIVQTGGVNGRLYFVTSRRDAVGVASAADAQTAMMQEARLYAILPQDLPPLTVDADEQGCLTTVNGVSTWTVSKCQVSAYISDGTDCQPHW